MEARKRHGDLPAHGPSCQPVHTVTGLASALGEATLPLEEGKSVTLLAISGGKGGRSFPGERTCGSRMFFVYDIQRGLWLVL